MLEIPARITEVAEALARQDAAPALIERYRAELAEASTGSAQAQGRKALFVLGGGGRPLLVAGRDTTVAAMIELAGGRNVTRHTGYQLLSPEAIMGSAPEVLLMLGDALQADGTPVILGLPGVNRTPAARNRQWHVVDGHCISGGMGLSTPSCIDAIRASLEAATP
ncbi:ABC transporter substrate-binding protein [Alkalilimnicola ehrlichii]|uniref:Fe/B12 periplasmic-binding domain-containing protein n=1 Tax=Alkalilimnicola ehrlichii TaxID=351052 RepID=A0A3E0WRM1_9GAMM|nr:ABC transporter substrate-binding protein [Alkalilimnicola ehrlichii]RFA34625.1 hypothetical protein CAL65_14780 [Alkalilimnicola ehrlichii]